MVSRIFSILKGEFFMSLFEQINKDYVTAYKAKDTQRVSVLRMLKASVKNRLVDLCRPGGTLTDEEMMDVILKEGKQRRDSIAEYEKAGRQDLADKENAELVILETISPSLSLTRSSPASSKRPLPRPAPLLPRKWERS